MTGLTVGSWMTRSVVTIGLDDTLAAAHRLMRRHGVRHLPVVDGDRLVGIVSDRDLHIVETLSGVDPDTEVIEEAMTSAPFTVTPETAIADVAEQMADHRYGSAVVLEGGAIVGIFTTIDALRCLAELVAAPEQRPEA